MPQYIDRPPRIQPELPVGTVEIPAPPKEENAQQPFWVSLVPVVTILGYVLVSLTGSGSYVTFLIPMALAVGVSTSVALYNTLSARRRARAAKAAYSARLIEMRRDMVSAHKRQRVFYDYNYPVLPSVLEMRADRIDNRSGSRLWERRTSDSDFGAVRIGIGVRASTVQYEVKERQDDSESPLMADAQRLQADARYVTDVPITIPLYQPRGDNSGVLAHSSIGIAGDPQDVYAFVRSVLAQYTAFHAPSDALLFILGLQQSAPQWEWAYELPHCQIDPNKGQSRIYFEDREIIDAPVSGVVREILVGQDVKKFSVTPGTVVARIERDGDGALVDVTASIRGHIQMIAIKRKDHVSVGDLLMRLTSVKLTSQQLEDLRKIDLNANRGKKIKRELAGVPRYWKEFIWTELDRRSRRLRDDDRNNVNVAIPFMLAVVDVLALQPASDETPGSWLEELESEAAVALITSEGRQLGVSTLFLVSDRSKVPSTCQAVVELKRDAAGQLNFLYAETGVNTIHYVGDADEVTADLFQREARFAEAISKLQVRRSYGADMARSVGLLDLHDARNIQDLDISGRWLDSFEPKKADWPKVPLGMLAGQEPRSLHFFADADGVHGMIAGSTGSGKSELLTTLILSLAANYDPSAVNFVLIDFKGGTAFDPLRDLPHVVDFVTNLKGNAVTRMFAAINAELNRRQIINKNTVSSDIVAYHARSLHLKRKDYYPHLFIIIDEFAEMIASRPEYKAQLDSITRLGRALGVSLILAAQNPSGVTDQMRANIKFRICLRVETKDQSNELLRRPDASFLPSIPGRGYLQVGSESLELIQVGYTGQPYDIDDYNDYDIYERYKRLDVIWEKDLVSNDQDAEKTFEVLARRIELMAEEKYPDVEKRSWRRPWPLPLPDRIALNRYEEIEYQYVNPDDRDYVKSLIPGNDEDREPFTLWPPIRYWLDGRQRYWSGIDWDRHSVRAVVGLIDDPSNAQLRILKVDFTRGNHVIFGGSRWGKTTFLRSVITALISTHSPEELFVYILDFGGRNLDIFTPMPHTGAYITSSETERVSRLLRMLDQEIETRKETIAAASKDNLINYNTAQLEAHLPVMPAILVAIDNFAEFKDVYEQYLDLMASLMREGTAAGIYFAVTAEQVNAVGKLLNLMPERMTLKLSDEGEYSALVGRGAQPVDDIAGRGLRRIERAPLEIQVALPVGASEGTDDEREDRELLIEFLRLIETAGQGMKRAPSITILPETVSLSEMIEAKLQLSPNGHLPAGIVLGMDDQTLSPKVVTLDKPHFIVTGMPSSGKTTALYSWILSLAEMYTPEQVAFVLVDYQKGLVDYGGKKRLDELPHALEPVISESVELQRLTARLVNEFKDGSPAHELYVFIDNYEDMKKLAGDSDAKACLSVLSDLARNYGKKGLHFVVCAVRDSLADDDLIRQITANRYGLAMDVDTAESAPFYASVPRVYARTVLPRGRGFVVYPGSVSVTQVALPYPKKDESTKADILDQWVETIQSRYSTKATWKPMPEKPAQEMPGVKAAREQRIKDCLAAKLEAKGTESGVLDSYQPMIDQMRNPKTPLDEAVDLASAYEISADDCQDNATTAVQSDAQTPIEAK